MEITAATTGTVPQDPPLDGPPQRGSLRAVRGDAGNPDALYGAFTSWVAGLGIELYPAQEEALLALFAGSNVVLSTPTGSGKSLVARRAALRWRLARDPIVLHRPDQGARSARSSSRSARIFGADERRHDHRRRLGQPATRRSLCCTAEILANLALRVGAGQRPRRGVWTSSTTTPTRTAASPGRCRCSSSPATQFLLMSATLGNTADRGGSRPPHRPRGWRVVAADDRPVPLEFDYPETPLHETICRSARRSGGARLHRPLHPARRPELAQTLTSIN